METRQLSLGERLAAYTKHISSGTVEPQTVSRHVFCLGLFLDFIHRQKGAVGLGSLCATEVVDFCLAYGADHKVDCRRHLHTTLRRFLAFAHGQQWIGQDLSAAVPVIRLYRFSRAPRPISSAAIEALLRSLDRDSEIGCRDIAIVQLLRIYGVRGVQLRRLCLTDLDWREDTIHFPVAKNGAKISAPLLPEAGNAILDYLRRFRAGRGRYRELFLTATDPPRPLAESSLSASLRKCIQDAGIRLDAGVKAGTHAFRYACATRMLQAGCTVKVVADALGHRNLNSVQIYNKLDLNSLRAVALAWPEATP